MMRLILLAVLCGCSANAGQSFAPSPPDDFRLRVARGEVGGVVQVHMSGGGSVGTTEDIIGDGTSLAEALPATGEPITCVSDDANDTAAGTGARTLTVSSLSNDYTEQTSTISMAGLSATTATSENILRIQPGTGVATVGTYGGSNVGTITCSGTPSGDVRFTIAPGEGVSRLAAVTVPAGQSFYINAHVVAPEGAKSPTVRFWAREYDASVNRPGTIEFRWPSLDNADHLHHETWEPFPAKTDVYYSGFTAATTDAVDVELEGFFLPE